jgi:flagellar biosynthetic protein FliQ
VNVEVVTGIGRGALEMALVLGGPVLLVALVTGLVVGVVQATTQVNELTLAFVPKIAASALALVVFGPWMLTRLVDYTRALLQSLPAYVR